MRVTSYGSLGSEDEDEDEDVRSIPCGEMKPQPCTLAFEKPLLWSMVHGGVPSLRVTPGHGGQGAYGGLPGRSHLPG